MRPAIAPRALDPATRRLLLTLRRALMLVCGALADYCGGAEDEEDRRAPR